MASLRDAVEGNCEGAGREDEHCFYCGHLEQLVTTFWRRSEMRGKRRELVGILHNARDQGLANEIQFTEEYCNEGYCNERYKFLGGKIHL